MKNRIIFLYIFVLAAFIAFVGIAWTMADEKDKKPIGQEYLDQFNIETSNPQPAGKNLTPTE